MRMRHSMHPHVLFASCLLLVLCQSVHCQSVLPSASPAPSSGDGGGSAAAYSIGASEPMRLTGAEFRAYENAWSVFFEAGQVDENNVLLVSLCRVQSSLPGGGGGGSGGTPTQLPAPCAPAAERYHLLDCAQLLRAVHDRQWHNAYIAGLEEAANGLPEAANGLCEDIRSAPRALQASLDNVLSDAAGGALVRLRPPHVLVVFNEAEVIGNWTTVSEHDAQGDDAQGDDAQGNNDGIRQDDLVIAFRVTQLAAVGEKFAVRHAVHNVVMPRPHQSALTLSMQNGCVAIGLSAPAFGNVRSVDVGGRPRCVWECRADMLRQPYNSEPPTPAQLDPSHPDHAQLAVKYACIALPSTWVAAVFGFVVETSVSPSDVGYAQALFDAVDRLALSVGKDMIAAGLQGVMLFSIRDTVYHSSFAERIGQLQAAACVVAAVADSACSTASSTVKNPDYVYRRRLLADNTLAQAQIEGLFIADQTTGLAEVGKIEQSVQSLRAVLVSAISKHSAVLADSDGRPLLRSIDDIDFSEIVSFTVPKAPRPGDTDSNTDSTTGDTGSTRGGAVAEPQADIGAALTTLGAALCAVIALVLFVAWRSQGACAA